MLLKNRCALVTGAGRNLGRAIALEMAREGASVIVNGRQDMESIRAVVKEIHATGGRAIAALADVSRPEQVAEMVNRGLSEFGSIDILVNNAALRSHTPFSQMSAELWHTIINTDLNGPFYCIKAVLAGMMERRYGRIINLIGTAAHRGMANHSAPAAAKAGLIGLTKSLAIELGHFGITVNGISPGPMNTSRQSGFPHEMLDASIRATPAGRAGEPREVARGCVYLTSDDASFVTGQILCINGGSYT